MSSIAYLKGEFLPLDQAQVSVLDRGFLFGDSIYEVIPVYQGRIFRLSQHLQRLQFSLKQAKIDFAKTSQQWSELLNELLARNGADDCSIYLQISRGAAARRDHAIPQEKIAPTLFLMVNVASARARKETDGIKAITLPDNRWLRCHIKTTALFANILLKQQALDEGAQDAILLRDGYVTESAAANVFVVRQGVILTPPKSPLILPGITRDLIVELAQQDGIALEEQPISQQQLRDADEIWVTSSMREIVPVIELDEKPVGDGEPGPVWQDMLSRFQVYKQALIAGQTL